MRALRAVLRGWRYLYGANPLHLLVMIGCFALVGYVVSMVYTDPSAYYVLVWFIGAVLAHDLVMYPLYALADQSLTVSRWARRKALPGTPPRVPAINHIRVPVLGSALLGLIFFPSIMARGAEAFGFTAGMPATGQYENWLLITGILFLGSAVLYAVRLGTSVGGTVGRRVAQGRRHRAERRAASDAGPVPAAATESG